MVSELLTVGTGVGTNYISSELLKKLDTFKENKAIESFKSYIYEWELDFERTHDGTVATRSCFFECVKYGHILERIISYVLLPDNGPSEDAFLNKLQQEMAAEIESACGQGLSADDKDILWCFLNSAVELAKKFLFSKMSLDDKALFYVICQNQSQLAEVQSIITEQFHITQEQIAVIHNQVNALCSNETVCTFPEEGDLPKEFDTLIAMCNSTLKRSQSKVRVYAWDDLDFEAVYVLPSLDISNMADRRFQHYFNDPFTILSADPMTDVVNKSLYSMFGFEEVELLKNREFSVPKRKAQISMAFREENIVYIIGGAGYGKSLFLKNLCIDPQLAGGSDEQPLLVIYGDLKRLIRPVGSLRPMTEFLEECFTNGSLRKSNEVYPNFLTMCLKTGRCLILLDALDEVSNDKRAELHSLILTYFTETYPDNKVCITSRSRGFIPDPQAMCVSIRPLTVSAVEEYVDKFVALDKFPLEEKSRFMEQAAVLVEKEFVKGFLTLSLLLAIYKNEQELPANKVLLYEKCFEYIANNREKKKNLLRNSSTGETYNWDVLGKLMSDATFMELSRLGTPNNSYVTREAIDQLMTDLYLKRFDSKAECHGAIDDFLQFCADRTEVFVPAPHSNAEYHFFHRSFYEYFYANYIAVRVTTVEETYKKLSVFDIDSEIFELLLAIYARRNPYYLRELIQYAFDQVNEHMSAAASKLGKSIDLLVMMMQAVEENDFIEQFIVLFLHRGSTIAKLWLRVTDDLVCNVFAKSNKCLVSEIQKNEKEILPKIRADFILFCLQNMSYCNELLTKNPGRAGMPIKRCSSVGFRYAQLLNFLPERLALLDKWFDDIKDPQYLSRLIKSHGKPVMRLLSFATRVKNQSVKKQEKIYMLLLAAL